MDIFPSKMEVAGYEKILKIKTLRGSAYPYLILIEENGV